MAGIEQYLDLIKNAVYGREVRQAIHDGIETCYKEGKAGATDLTARAEISEVEAALSARIDEIIAPSGEAPSAAEVTDARIGTSELGLITYDSLGSAIRGQATELLKGIDQTILVDNYLRDCKAQVFKKGSYYNTPASGDAVTEASGQSYYSCIFDVTEGEAVIMNASASTGFARLYVFIDANGKAIGRCPTNLTGTRLVYVPQGAVRMAVNNYLNMQADGFFVVSGKLTGDAFIATEIEQGTYDSTTGNKGFSTTYCRTPKYKFDDVIEINLPACPQYFIWRYDANGDFISRDGSANARNYGRDTFATAYKVSGAVYFAISICLNTTSTTPDMVKASDFRVRLNSKQVLYDKAISVDEGLSSVASRDLVSYVSKDFEQGGLDSSGNEGTSFVYCRTPFMQIGSAYKIYKPTGVFIIVYMYDQNHTFIDRTSFDDSTSETIEGDSISRTFGKQGGTAYLRISAKRVVDGADVESVPNDIVASGLEITLVGASEDIYSQIYELKGMVNDDSAGLPSYYEPYITNKINAINTLEDNMSSSDSFIFLTDYHYTKNAQNSPKLIKKIVEETGITKFFFGGDAGVSAPLASMYRAARDNGKVYQNLWDSAPHFYGMVGNHEWNDRQDETHERSQQPEVYSREGVYNFYVSRQEPIVKGMSPEGNYYVDNNKAKIRYFVLQSTGQAKITNETVKWLGDQLAEVPDGWYVIVLNHYAYTGGVTGTDSMTGRGNLSVLRIAQLLGGLKEREAEVTVNQYANTGETTGTYTFDYSDKSVTPIAIVSGHTHWDASLTVAQSVYGILTVATTTDAFGYNQNALTHLLEPRQVGTTDEQAFDVVQIDLTARKLYMTRIGGGSDREFTF